MLCEKGGEGGKGDFACRCGIESTAVEEHVEVILEVIFQQQPATHGARRAGTSWPVGIHGSEPAGGGVGTAAKSATSRDSIVVPGSMRHGPAP